MKISADIFPKLNAQASMLAWAFRCPECHHNVLEPEDDNLVCPACRAQYPIKHGVPVLLSGAGIQMRRQELSSTTGQTMVREYQAIRAGANIKNDCSPRQRPWFSWLRPPQVIYHPNPHLELPETKPLFNHRGKDTLVLNVGGGPSKYRSQEVTLNLEVFYNVDIVGDAHNLPLGDECVDTVICNAVLEHVRDPQRVVSELLRVLKPGGLLYAEAPFIFFFHGYPNDFTRFTREGMRRLFADLDETRIGISGGPMSALLQTANIVLQMMVPVSLPALRKLVNGAFRWVAFPLKYLDIILNKREEAHLTASGFYVLGKKALGQPALKTPKS